MWYYAQNGKTFGPVSLEKLKELARTGVLKPTDHVLPVGAQDWRVASTQADLFAAPRPNLAPPPRPGQARSGPPPVRPDSPPPMPEEEYASQGPMTWSLASHPLGDDLSIPPREAEAPTFGRKVGRHFARLFTWNLQKVSVDEDEQRFLQKQGIEDPTLQRYLVWRHSLLLVLVFPVFLLALLNTIDYLSGGVSNFNGLGKTVLVFFILFPFALPFAALLALIIWHRPKLSWRLLLIGWVVGTAGPLLMNAVPLYARVDVDAILMGEAARPVTEEEREAGLMTMRLLFGIAVFGLLMIQLPIFGITAIYGTQRACLRLKTLLPQSSIPGLFLAITGPVFAFLILPFFVTASQLASSPFLLLGAMLLMASPMLYTFSFKRMVSPLLEAQDFTRLYVLQISAAILFWLGVLFLLVYAFTVRIPFLNPDVVREIRGPQAKMDAPPGREARAEPSGPIVQRTLIGFSSETSWLRPWSWRLFRWLLVEVLGRSLFTMILVADLFMRVNSYIWLSSRKVLGSDQARNYDELMERLQTSGRWGQEISRME